VATIFIFKKRKIMNDMEIIYEYVNITASDRLENHIEEKLATIKKR